MLQIEFNDRAHLTRIHVWVTEVLKDMKYAVRKHMGEIYYKWG